ncbi:MAG TPA: hypothetical protein VHC48_06780 [Puia sp.]|nr:hypothetical protein [Puia sp.]
MKRSNIIPLLLAVLATVIYVLFLERSVMKVTGGVFSYPLDDPFIHMQVARNLAQHGVWGINPSEFASASSSVLYTLLLTLLFKVFPVNILIPFVINVIAAVVLLAVIHRWLLKQQAGVAARTVILLLVVVFAPLPVLIISGMEHILQCIFSFLFITSFAGWMEQWPAAGSPAGPGKGWRLPWRIYVYAMLLTGIRYEGLFLVMVAGLILLYHRKLATAAGLGLAASLLIVIFGIYSVGKGSYFLPNSVLIKSDSIRPSLAGIVEFIQQTLVNKWSIDSVQPNVPGGRPPGISLAASQRLLILLPVTFLFFLEPLRQRRSWVYFLLLVTGCTLLHLALAATGWFYRYEAYLVVASIVILSMIYYRWGAAYLKGKPGMAIVMTGLLAFMVFFPFVLRSAAAYSKAKQACLNIYDQQYQMAQFLHTYYKGEAVAANDIGAVAFYGDLRVVDLWGLGDIDVARSRKGQYCTPVFLDSVVRARKARLAIVFETWFDKSLLDRWTKVATWQMPNNVICGYDVVTFYAIDAQDKGSLEDKLKAYQPSLPKEISVVYY